MLKVLRRCRLLALTLLLAGPGLGGTWLSVAHPCPVDSPRLAEQHGHGGHTPGSESTPSGHDRCVCLGSCHVPSLTAPVQSVAGPGDAPLFDLAAPRPGTEFLAPAGRPSRLQPPSTAPPLLS